MATPSHVGAIRLVALRNVLDEPDEYVIRKICRWYSRTLCTPIAEVYRLPWDHVLLHYFESQYEGMDEGELAEERLLLLETNEERDAREMQAEKKKSAESVSDDKFLRMVRERAAAALRSQSG
jgi:hypothetical protein